MASITTTMMMPWGGEEVEQRLKIPQDKKKKTCSLSMPSKNILFLMNFKLIILSLLSTFY